MREPEPESRALTEADALLTKATALNDAADFEAALEKAEDCARTLGAQCDAKANRIKARCHVIAAMAAAGLDRRERAIEEFRQAFVLDPQLKLSAEMTSPRIQELVSAAQPRRPTP